MQAQAHAALVSANQIERAPTWSETSRYDTVVCEFDGLVTLASGLLTISARANPNLVVFDVKAMRSHATSDLRQMSA